MDDVDNQDLDLRNETNKQGLKKHLGELPMENDEESIISNFGGHLESRNETISKKIIVLSNLFSLSSDNQERLLKLVDNEYKNLEIDKKDTQKIKVESSDNHSDEGIGRDIPKSGSEINWFGKLSEFNEIPSQPIKTKPSTLEPEDSNEDHWIKEHTQPSKTVPENSSISFATNSVSNQMDKIEDINPRTVDDIPTQPPSGKYPTGVSVQPVPQVDFQATVVTPSAYQGAPISRQMNKKTGTVNKPLVSMEKIKKVKKKKGCFTKIFLFLLFTGIFLLILIGSIGIYQYFRIASSLPSVEELQARASQFETTRILDRNGNLLYEIIDPNAGKRTFVPLDKISPYLIAATLATEDKEFYNHPGFDPIALARALWSNYTSGEIVSGASTITQQLARMLLLPDERFEQSYARKAREIILASEIDRRYSKEEILELYLNEIYYGNLAYGIEAAAQTYFNTNAKNLSLWQASFLAGLPQAPSVYDIYNNRDATLARNRDVLVLMYELSLEKNCIYVSTNLANVCVDAVQALKAAETLESFEFEPPTYKMRFPHWVVYIQSLLEEQFDPQTIYRSGFTVVTTLDPDLQTEAQRMVKEQIANLQVNNASNGAVIAIKPNTGEILAMVGSADFYNEEISGQVNMAITDTRQPGSSIKPITYLAAFEKGWTPSSLIWDVPTDFSPSGRPDDLRPAYQPVNYDRRAHGPVTVRTALANSYNIPAVKALDFVGIYDDPTTSYPDGFIETAKRLGITSLVREDYGLSLTLGGGEVSLLEMTGAYSVFANAGKRIAPVAITRIVDHSGNLIYEYSAPAGDQVIRPEHAYLISSILSDTSARIPAFGTNPVINLPFTAAAKTGTTNDFRDNWTIGYTPDLVVGVWVGNADYTPMINTSGLTGAAPIWANIMQYGIPHLVGGNPSVFVRPGGIVDRVICSISGAEPSEWCPEQRSEIFASDQLPLPKTSDLWTNIEIDTWTELLASDDCDNFTEEKMALNVKDKFAIKWLKEADAGKAWSEKYGFSDPIYFVPERACNANDSRPIIRLPEISNGQIIKVNPLEIVGIIDATSNFKEFRLDYGIGENPSKWEKLIFREQTPIKTVAKIFEWDLTDVEPGIITLRITVFSTNDTTAIKKFRLILDVPTPTPTETPTPTPTETPTMTPTFTETPDPNQTPTITSTSSSTPTVTETHGFIITFFPIETNTPKP